MQKEFGRTLLILPNFALCGTLGLYQFVGMDGRKSQKSNYKLNRDLSYRNLIIGSKKMILDIHFNYRLSNYQHQILKILN